MEDNKFDIWIRMNDGTIENSIQRYGDIRIRGTTPTMFTMYQYLNSIGIQPFKRRTGSEKNTHICYYRAQYQAQIYEYIKSIDSTTPNFIGLENA